MRSNFLPEICSTFTLVVLSLISFQIERIARIAFETARKRRGKLCSVDKANVLEVKANFSLPVPQPFFSSPQYLPSTFLSNSVSFIKQVNLLIVASTWCLNSLHHTYDFSLTFWGKKNLVNYPTI